MIFHKFSDRKIALAIAEMGVRFLQVKGNWVVQTGLDLRIGQLLANAFSIGLLDHIKMIDVPPLSQLRR